MSGFRGIVTSLRSSLRLVWSADRRSMLVISFAQATTAVVAVISLLGLRTLISRLEQGASSIDDLWLPSVVLVAATAVTSTLGVVISEVRLVANDAVERTTTLRVLEGANRAEFADFEEASFHDLLRRASHRASARAWGAVWASITLVTSAVTVAAISIALAILAPVVFAVAVIGAAPGFFVARRNSRILYDVNYWQTSEDRRRSALERLLRERRYAAEVRTLRAEGQLLDRIRVLFDDRLSRTRGVARKRLAASASAAVVSAVLAGIALLVLVSRIASGSLSLADGLVALVALQQVAGRMRTIATSLSDLDEAGLYLQDHDRFVAEANRKRGNSGRSLPVGEIELANVSFRYPDREADAVHNIELVIRPGEFVALVGENGSGKTTLSKIIGGLYQPSSGAITWDGAECPAADRLASTRCVYQDYARFPLSLRDNIGLGVAPRLSDERLYELIDTIGLSELTSSLGDGVDALLAREFDGGTDLSGGQWQRLAVARALAVDSSLLILDEPSAALDPRQERELVSTLRRACAGRTVIFVSHRFSAVRDADRIFVLNGGQIVERGPHDSLMAADGLYADLFTLQAEGYQ